VAAVLEVTAILAKAVTAGMGPPHLRHRGLPVLMPLLVMEAVAAVVVVAELQAEPLVTAATALAVTLKFGSTEHEHETLCTTKRQHRCKRN
jgi:hypothetical protein